MDGWPRLEAAIQKATAALPWGGYFFASIRAISRMAMRSVDPIIIPFHTGSPLWASMRPEASGPHAGRSIQVPCAAGAALSEPMETSGPGEASVRQTP